MSASTLYIEIEQKYRANVVDWDEFVQFVCSFGPVEQLRVRGPDTYYDVNGEILRWRMGKDKQELTVKNRHSQTSVFTRKEIDLNICDNSVKTVLKFISALGAKRLFRIYKDCHIFWFDRKEGRVSVVIYDVFAKNQKVQRFIEIEAEKGQPYQLSKKLVRIWEKRLRLKVSQRLSRSLYEIYSGQRTPQNKKGRYG